MGIVLTDQIRNNKSDIKYPLNNQSLIHTSKIYFLYGKFVFLYFMLQKTNLFNVQKLGTNLIKKFPYLLKKFTLEKKIYILQYPIPIFCYGLKDKRAILVYTIATSNSE